MDKLRLEVLLKAVDKVTGPLKSVMAGSSATSRKLKSLRDSFKALEQQRGLIESFRNAHKASKGLRAEIGAQQAKVKALAAEHAAAGTVTDAMARKMAKAKSELDALRARVGPLRQSIQSMTSRMQQAGLSTKGLAAQETQLRSEIERTNASINQQKQRLQALAAAQHKAGRMAATGAGMTAAGVGTAYGANRAGHAMFGMMGQARHMGSEELRIRALGLGDDESSKAIEYAKNFKSYGVSQLDNLELMRDAVTVFNDRHHAEEAMPILADMKFANKAAFGEEQGGENARKFMDMMKVIEMRGGANNVEDFTRNANMVQQVISATGGRVGAADWMHVIKRGKLAAKGFDEKEFYYRLEPLVQEMGGDAVGTGLTAAYQNLYQGRTTKRAANNLDKLGLIADRKKVMADKAGQVKFLDPGALLGADVFRRSQFEWMETVLLPALEKRGITDEQEIIDTIGSIFSNTNAGALMATMFQQRKTIQKGYELNSKAANIKQLKALGMESPAGKEEELRARRDDLEAGLGQKAMPLYVKLLEKLTAVVEKVTEFTEKNPGMAKAIIYTGVVFAGLAAVSGALLIPLGLILAKTALLRMVFSGLGLSIGTVAPGMGVLYKLGFMLGKALSWAGKAFGVLRLAMRMAWPWVTKMLRLGGITTAIFALLDAVITFAKEWDGTWENLGSAIWKGIEAGLNAATFGIYGFLKRTISEGTSAAAKIQGTASAAAAAAALAATTTAAMPAESLHKVEAAKKVLAEATAAAGNAISPAAQALGSGKVNLQRPSSDESKMAGAKKLWAKGAEVASNSSSPAAEAVGSGKVNLQRPDGDPVKLAPMQVLAPKAAPQTTVTTTNNNTFHITAAPGMDAKQVASAVSSEMDRRARQQESRSLGQLYSRE